MIRLLVLLLLALASFSAKGQKQIDVPQNDKRDQQFYESLPEQLAKYNLQDLTKTTDSLYLRIWTSNEIVEVRKQEDTHRATLTNWINFSKPIIRKTEFGQDTSRKLMEALVANKILEIPDDSYRGIDGSYITFEIATPEKYRLYSYWSPYSSSLHRQASTKNVVKLDSLIATVLDRKGHVESFLQTLEPGGYRWGMSSLQVDRLLPEEEEERSSLYKKVEEVLISDFNITRGRNHFNFPMMLIDGKPVSLAHLNKYEVSDVESIKVHRKGDSDSSAIYGERAREYGMILIKKKADK